MMGSNIPPRSHTAERRWKTFPARNAFHTTQTVQGKMDVLSAFYENMTKQSQCRLHLAGLLSLAFAHSTDGRVRREKETKTFPSNSPFALKWLTHFHKNNFLIFCRFSSSSRELAERKK